LLKNRLKIRKKFDKSLIMDKSSPFEKVEVFAQKSGISCRSCYRRRGNSYRFSRGSVRFRYESEPLSAPPHLMKVSEAATWLNISRALAYEIIANGHLPSVTITIRGRRRLRITSADLENFANNCHCRPSPSAAAAD